MRNHLARTMIVFFALVVLTSCDSQSMGIQIIEVDSQTYLIDNSIGADNAVYLVDGDEITRLDEKPTEYLQVGFDDVRGTSVLQIEMIVFGDALYWHGRIAPSTELISREADGELSSFDLWKENIRKEGNFINLAITHSDSNIIYSETRLSMDQFNTSVLGSGGELSSYSGSGSGYIDIDHNLIKLRNTTTNSLKLDVSYVLDIEEP